MSKVFSVLGCGFHGRGVANVIMRLYPDAKISFVDDNAQPNEKIMGFDVVTTIPTATTDFVAGAGDNLKRRKLAEGHEISTVIAATAEVGYQAQIGSGCFVGEGAFIGSEVMLKEGVIVNTHAIVEHNSEIGNYCNICPGAIILGQCILGDNVFLGAGAKVKNNVWICSNVIIGMGAVVLNDITESGTYVGCPARKINDNTEEHHVRRARNS